MVFGGLGHACWMSFSYLYLEMKRRLRHTAGFEGFYAIGCINWGVGCQFQKDYEIEQDGRQPINATLTFRRID
jgi:hypothetical protein